MSVYINPPDLDAYRTDEGQLAVWCTHEQRWHYHGGCYASVGGACARKRHRDTTCSCPVGKADGHRVAHCSCAGSPLRNTGYMLREVGRFTVAIRRAHKEARISQLCQGVECIAAREERDERAWRFKYGQDVLEIACPKCTRGVGEKCLINRGHIHAARYNARMRESRPVA